jgi:molybdopterin-guanine dinucleotide biosynthesis protein A
MLASRGDADIVIAHGWDTEHAKPGQPPQLRAQPVFCLLRASPPAWSASSPAAAAR